MDKRDYLFDNIKGIMLFLVAFGHSLDVFLSNGAFEMTLMKYIYLFHMPMFAFVTGYFSKNADKSREKAVKNCFMPYLVFQGIYAIMGFALIRFGIASFNSDVFKPSLLIPTSAFYYLLAVFFWKYFLKDFIRFKHPVALSIFLGLAISLTSFQELHIGYGAVFSLLCFFIVGFYVTKETVEKIRSFHKVYGILILLAGILPACFLPYAIHSIRFTYERQGFTTLVGIGYRLAFYAIAFLMIFAIINLVSDKKTILSRIGKSSIVVYCGSTFLAPHAYVILANVLHLNQNRVVNLIGMLVFTSIIVYILSLPVFLKLYNIVMGWINKLIFSE